MPRLRIANLWIILVGASIAPGCAEDAQPEPEIEERTQHIFATPGCIAQPPTAPCGPISLSQSTLTSELFLHTSVASSPQPWVVTKVKSSAGDVLDKSNWVFAVSDVGTTHVATLSLNAGYTATDPYLITLFAQRDLVSVKVRFGNGDTETLFVKLGP